MTILRSCSEMLLTEDRGSYDKIIGVTRSVYNSGRTKPLKFRENALKGLLHLFQECSEEITEALRKDLRKSELEATFFELEVVRGEILYMLKNLRKFARDETLPFNTMAILDKAFIRREPFGVCLVVGSWNYPFVITMKPLIGAIAAGNCVVIKPSEISTECAKFMAKRLPQYIDPECYPVIVADAEGTKQLLRYKFDYIFYTGTATVGSLIYQAAAANLTPVTLELGGKSPCFIDENSHPVRTTKRILWGKLANLGQTCIAPDYILCSERFQQQFVEAARNVLQKWYGTSNLQKSRELSRIINKRHFQRLKNLLDTTKGTVALGGGSDEEDLWIEPTIVVNVKPDDVLMQDEIFGPIIPIVTINSPDDAIKLILSKPKPLALYVFSNRKSVVKTMLSSVSSGGTCVNDVVMQNPWKGLPFGGVGTSGLGNYHGKYTFETFSHKRAVLVRSNSALSEMFNEPRYAPFTSSKVALYHFAGRNFEKFNVNISWMTIFTHVLFFCLGLLVFYGLVMAKLM